MPPQKPQEEPRRRASTGPCSEPPTAEELHAAIAAYREAEAVRDAAHRVVMDARAKVTDMLRRSGIDVGTWR